MYRTAKKGADDMTRFAKGLSREEIVSQVMQYAHVRSLPIYETRNRLVDRLKVVTEAAGTFRVAIKAESGIEEAMKKETIDEVAEDESVQDIVTILYLLLNAKVEYNGKGGVSS